MINKFAALLLIGMASPYQILDWYGHYGVRHTCHTASGALAAQSYKLYRCESERRCHDGTVSAEELV